MRQYCLLIFALFISQINSLSYVQSWGVYEGCRSGCCCPEHGALVEIKNSGSGTMTLQVKKGSWVGCELYGWDSDDKITLPWNDDTLIDLSKGVSTSYANKNDVLVHWTWYPILGEAQEKSNGVKKGDPVALIKVDQGGIKGCKFTISANKLNIAVVLISLFILILSL